MKNHRPAGVKALGLSDTYSVLVSEAAKGGKRMSLNEFVLSIASPVFLDHLAKRLQESDDTAVGKPSCCSVASADDDPEGSGDLPSPAPMEVLVDSLQYFPKHDSATESGAQAPEQDLFLDNTLQDADALDSDSHLYLAPVLASNWGACRIPIIS